MDRIENLNENNIIILDGGRSKQVDKINIPPIEITGTSFMDRLKVFLPILNNICVRSGIKLADPDDKYPDTTVRITKRILKTILNNNIFIIYNGKYESEQPDEQLDEEPEVAAQSVEKLTGQVKKLKMDGPDSESFKNKYLKYKQKYLALKAQLNL